MFAALTNGFADAPVKPKVTKKRMTSKKENIKSSIEAAAKIFRPKLGRVIKSDIPIRRTETSPDPFYSVLSFLFQFTLKNSMLSV